MDDDLQIRQALRDAAERRATAEAARTAAMEELRDLVRKAHRLQVPIATIAKDAGMSRPTVYALLADE
jgi:DNA-binding phage protein